MSRDNCPPHVQKIRSETPQAVPSTGRGSRRPLSRMVAAASLVAGLTCTTPGLLLADELASCRLPDSSVTPQISDEITQHLDKSELKAAQKLLEPLIKASPTDARLNFFQARLSRRLNVTSQAEKSIRLVLEKDPQCGPAILLLGELLETSNRADEAIKLYEAQAIVTPGDVTLHRRLGQLLITRSQLEKALPHLLAVRDANPNDLEAVAAVAEVQGWLGRASEAVENFRAAEKLAPTGLSADRRKTYAEALRQTRQYEAALEQCELALKMSPRNPSVRLVKGQILMDTQQFPAAASLFQEVTAQQPRNAYAWASLARALTASDRRAEAYKPYRQALEITPKDDDLRIEAAQVLSALPQYRDEAISLLKPLTDRPDAKPEHLLALAEILSWQPERRFEALQIMDKLMARNLSNEVLVTKLKTHFRQTVLWIPPSATLVPAAEKALSLWPGDIPLLVQVASCQAQDPGRRADAIQSFERVLAVQPDNGEVRIARAELLALKPPANLKPIRDDLVLGASQTMDRPELQLRAGNSLLSLGFAEESLACFDRAMAKESTQADAQEGRISALSMMGRTEEALAAIDATLKNAPPGARRAELSAQRQRLELVARRAKAQALFREGKLKESEAAWKDILRDVPDDADGWTTLGGVQSTLGNFKEALRSFDRALELRRDHPGALEGRLGALMALDQPEDALEALIRLKGISTNSGLEATEKKLRYKIRVKQARQLILAGRRLEAESLLQQLFKEDDTDFELALLLGSLLLQDKQYPGATEAYQRAMRLQPDNPAAMQGLASAKWESKNRIEALGLLRTTYARAPQPTRKNLADQLIAWEVTIAEEAKAAGNYAFALDHYREAYSLDPERDYVLKGLGGLYWSTGQLELASKFYGLAAVKRPNDVEALRGASETLLARGLPHLVVKLLENNPASSAPELQKLLLRAQLEKDLETIETAWKRGETEFAVSLTREAANRNPTSVEPWMRLARLQAQSGDGMGAITSYKRVLMIEPDNQAALLSLIAALQSVGKYPESGDLIRQMRARDAQLGRITPELDPLEAASWAARGTYLARLGQREQALTAWRRALELGLEAPWLFSAIGRLYAENQQPELALSFYELALSRDKDNRDAARARVGLLLSLGRSAEAASTVQWLNQQEDANKTDRILMAELAKQEGDPVDAVERYRTLHDEDPQDISISRGLVGALLANGRPWEALDLVNTLLTERPVDKGLLLSAVAALRGMYASDLAVPVLRKVKKYWPSPAIEKELQDTMLAALIEAAEAAKERGDMRRARQLYNEAAQQAPQKAEVLRGIAGLEARNGEHAAALKHFRDALKVAPDDGIAIAGHASSQASLGRYYLALDELKEGWSRTRSPRVGVEWIKLLEGRERYQEAGYALARLEESLGISSLSSEEELDALRLAPQNLTLILSSLERFEQVWPRVARRVPRVRQVAATTPLPELKWKVPTGVKRTPPETTSATVANVKPTKEQLPDLAPDIPIPTGFNDLQAMATPRVPDASGRIDLWMVDKMLNDMQSKPVGSEDGSSPDDADAAPVVRAVLNPWSAQDTIEEVDEGRATTNGEDLDDYGAYRPLISRGRPYARFIPPLWDPISETLALRKTLDSHTGTRLYLGGWLNARTGTAGTTEAFGAFGDLRLGIQLPGLSGLTLEPYAQPGMVTDGDDFQPGTMVGAAIYSHPGRFEVYGRIGSTPMGFRGGTSVTGMFKVGVDAADLLHINVEASVDPVTDSLLSWAGKRSEEGLLYGHVTRTRGAGSITVLLDARTSLVLGGDISRYQGLRMSDNRSRMGQMVFQHAIPTEDSGQFKLNVKLNAFGYERQQDSFEVGGGGYFSPLLFLVASGGGMYSGKGDDDRFHYTIGLDVGAQYVEGEETDSLTPGVKPVISAAAEGELSLSPGLVLGARYEFDNVGADYTRNTVWIYLTRHFGQANRGSRD